MPLSPPCIEFDEIDSTNQEALRRSAAGERGPLWIMARRQMAGRGRSGREWVSPDGNLAATLLFEPDCPPAALHQLSFVAGVAVHDALDVFRQRAPEPAAIRLRLKWPNDILDADAKLAGILIESTMSGGAPVAAIGIGVNIATAPIIAGRATTSMASWSPDNSPGELRTSIALQITRWLEIWQHGNGFSAIRTAWLDRTFPLGETITVNTGTETLIGTFSGIDETGALLLDSVPPKPGQIRRISYGDVSFLPPDRIAAERH